MASEEIHVDDIGTSIRIKVQEENLNVDISAATLMRIKLKKPSGALDTHSASFVTDGTDALMHFVSIAGDIDEAGTWRIQGFIILPEGEFNTSIGTFKVLANLDTLC